MAFSDMHGLVFGSFLAREKRKKYLHTLAKFRQFLETPRKQRQRQHQRRSKTTSASEKIIYSRTKRGSILTKQQQQNSSRNPFRFAGWIQEIIWQEFALEKLQFTDRWSRSGALLSFSHLDVSFFVDFQFLHLMLAHLRLCKQTQQRDIGGKTEGNIYISLDWQLLRTDSYERREGQKPKHYSVTFVKLNTNLAVVSFIGPWDDPDLKHSFDCERNTCNEKWSQLYTASQRTLNRTECSTCDL